MKICRQWDVYNFAVEAINYICFKQRINNPSYLIRYTPQINNTTNLHILCGIIWGFWSPLSRSCVACWRAPTGWHWSAPVCVPTLGPASADAPQWCSPRSPQLWRSCSHTSWGKCSPGSWPCGPCSAICLWSDLLHLNMHIYMLLNIVNNYYACSENIFMRSVVVE